MDGLDGVGLNPVPFIASAYFIGLFLILGYGLWLYNERRKLRQQLAAVFDDQGEATS